MEEEPKILLLIMAFELMFYAAPSPETRFQPMANKLGITYTIPNGIL